jgi:hypothetical protein
MSVLLPQLFAKETIHLLQDFDAPAEKVFAFFSDHERWSEMFPAAFKRIQFGEDPKDANSKGSVRRIIAFPLVIEETITEYRYPHLIEYKVTYGFGLKNHCGTMQFIDIGNGKCRLDYKIVFEPALPLSGFVLRNLLQKLISNGVGSAARKFRENPNY